MLVTKESELPAKGFRPWMWALAVTAGLHLIFAGILALRQVPPFVEIKPELSAELAPLDEEARKKILKESIKKRVTQTRLSAPAMSRVIRSDALASLAVPKMKTLDDSPIGLGEGDLGAGLGQGPQNLGRGAMFFGQRVTGRLGVVFDVSGSMHPYVPIVVDEIQRNFRTAMVVCVNSSIFRQTEGEQSAIRFREIDHSKVSIFSTTSEAGRQMKADLEDLPNCWYMEREYNTLGHAIEHLIDNRATAIFVFTDFNDSFDANYATSLGALASTSRVQLHLHALEPFSFFWGAREESLKALAEETGGRFAAGDLVERAKARE